LNIHYGVPEVWGVYFGFQGLYSKHWQLLDLPTIKNLQLLGGTFLGSSRGGFDAPAMV
jgi:6-phosphofructokinase